MNRKSIVSAVCVAAYILTVFVGSATAADNKAAKGAVPATPLTDAGQKLEAQYAEQLKALRTEIEAALPKVSEGKIASLQKACAALKTAEEQAKAAGEAAGKSAQAKSAIGIWTKYSIPDATKKIAEREGKQHGLVEYPGPLQDEGHRSRGETGPTGSAWAGTRRSE